MKRLLIAPLVMMGALTVAPAAHADSVNGAYQTECTKWRPGTVGGNIIITPNGNILLNCQYPGPAEGGGADVTSYQGCVITPAGNFQCHP
jgi:hypothetical protein